MADEVKWEIEKDGTIRGIYSDALQEVTEAMGAEVRKVCRASNVEWEENECRRGWTVRAAHNPNLAARLSDSDLVEFIVSDDIRRPLAYFPFREEAIRWEVRHFFQLLPPKEERGA